MFERIFTLVSTILILIMPAINLTQKNVENTSSVSCTISITDEAETIVHETLIQTEEIEVLETQIQNEEALVLQTEPIEEIPYVEKFPEVPLFFQTDYPNTRYGHATVATHGCGIASLSMILTYLLDREIMPDTLAEEYGRYNGEHGSSWNLFPDSAADYGVTIEKQTWKWEDVVEALKNGQVCIANAQKESIFTNGGHFIVLYGITEEGRILVRDPNKYNYGEWSSKILKEGFANGFEQKSVQYNCFPCWIYAKKDLDAIAEQSTEDVDNP